MTDLRRQVATCLDRMGLALAPGAASDLTLRSPIDAQALAELCTTNEGGMVCSLQVLQGVQPGWAALPASRRGQVLRVFSERLRAHRSSLAQLITLETGKVTAEAIGEVQEMIDMCDFGVGLSRQLHGLVIPPKRLEHRISESWHPFGICGVISAFNLPVAFWAWNAVLALVCGNGLIWKPSEKAPLSAFAEHGLLRLVLAEAEPDFVDISQLWIGGHEQGSWLVEHPAVRLISAAGSTQMGRAVALRCAAQFKRGIFKLGGNNAVIVRPSADLALAARSIVFAAIGTSGQRCTTLRRAFIHSSVYEQLVVRLKTAYADLHIGHPAENGTQMGPLIDGAAYLAMAAALAECAKRGNRVTGGQRLNADLLPRAFYVRPALVETEVQHDTMIAETFAPILYLQRVDDLDEAIALNNAVAHGLSSCIFTNSLREAERFTSLSGSDCGIANVNVGTSDADIGRAFSGEKDSGGGCEAGSDTWKNYMRRATSTMNFGAELPLAQGVRFDL